MRSQGCAKMGKGRDWRCWVGEKQGTAGAKRRFARQRIRLARKCVDTRWRGEARRGEGIDARSCATLGQSSVKHRTDLLRLGKEGRWHSMDLRWEEMAMPWHGIEMNRDGKDVKSRGEAERSWGNER